MSLPRLHAVVLEDLATVCRMQSSVKGQAERINQCARMLANLELHVRKLIAGGKT